ncbi:MAG: SemiSWEET transporter [Ignavibacteria bacterium]
MDFYILLIGFAAAFLTTFAFLPQSIRTIRTKETKGLSLTMLIMIDLGLIAWLCYGLLISSLPIITANSVSLIFITFILILKIKYG